MTKLWFTMAMVVVMAVCPTAFADKNEAKKSENSKQPALSKEEQAHMAKMIERGSPGPEHKVLNLATGTWKAEARSWMKPEDKPHTTVGTSKVEWVLGGRFLRQSFEANWGGQPYEGVGFTGYDKVRKEYVSVWIDNMSTGMFQTTGQYNPKTKTITESGTFSCPVTGNKNRWVRTEFQLLSKTKHVYRMFHKDSSGKEYKSMEITYTRK